MTNRWTRRPEGSNWGDFGPDDELGRLNLITPEKVLQGMAEVKEGRTFCLSLPLDYPGGNVLNPRRFPPQRFATLAKDEPMTNRPTARDNPAMTDVINDDSVRIWTQYSTQWDSFAHVGARFDADGDGEAEIVFYNGWRGGNDIVVTGDAHDGHPEGTDARRLGIEKMAAQGVQGRAVMIDLRAHFGDEKRWCGYDDIMRVMEADTVSVETGDMVCFHTGFADRLLGMNKAPRTEDVHGICAGLDGRDPALLKWVAESGAAALIADNYAVEGFPARPGEGDHPMLPLHELCLFKLGIHLGEIWHLTPLAAYLREKGRSRFLLTAPPLRLPHAVGSPVTPIATV